MVSFPLHPLGDPVLCNFRISRLSILDRERWHVEACGVSRIRGSLLQCEGAANMFVVISEDASYYKGSMYQHSGVPGGRELGGGQGHHTLPI